MIDKPAGCNPCTFPECGCQYSETTGLACKAEGRDLTNVTREQALSMLARATMRPFDKVDWETFSGCDDPNPMIGEIDGSLIVLDGASITVMRDEDPGGGMLFELGPNLC